MPKFTTPAGTTQRYISALDRNAPDSIPGTKKVYADRAAFLQGVADERACIAMGLPVWYDGIDLQVLAEPAAVKRLWTLSTNAGSAAANATASHGRTAVIAFKKFTLATDDARVHATSGAPASGLGDNGDLALDETAGTVYRKATGAWAAEASFGSGSSGSGVTPVPYSTTVPLDGSKVMPRTQIAAAVALSIGAKVAGGSCRIPFLSNGTHVPTIAGASEWATSFGFDNSAAGLLNVLDLWTDDGTNVGYSWTQPVSQSGGSDTTAPTLVSASVADSSPSVVALAFSETMDTAFTPSASALTISGHTVTPVTAGQSVTASYTVPGSNPIRDTANNAAAAFTNVAVTNNTSGSGDDFADWQSRLAAAGGSASQTELDAVQAFINTAKNGATPFWSKLYRANAFVNNAGGSLVPFKKQSGSADDTSPAATAVNAGGRGNTSGTGYVNTQTPPPAADGGLSVYLRDLQSTNPAAANVAIGCRDSANTQNFRIGANLNGNDGQATAGYVNGAWGGPAFPQATANTGAAMQVGHWHVHRSGATSLKLRRNGTLVGSEVTSSVASVPVTEPIFVFAQNSGGTAGAFTKTPTSIGYYAILSGTMTDAEATAYNTAVVALMTAMGRNL